MSGLGLNEAYYTKSYYRIGIKAVPKLVARRKIKRQLNVELYNRSRIVRRLREEIRKKEKAGEGIRGFSVTGVSAVAISRDGTEPGTQALPLDQRPAVLNLTALIRARRTGGV